MMSIPTAAKALPDPRLPIGIFDSGVGGLTVFDAIQRLLPGEDLLYLGDTARVPYGTRSPSTVIRYAQRVSGHLVNRGIKALVVACNTASTWALKELETAGAQLGIPVLGVIKPGVTEALARTQSNHIGVIGTEGTIRGGRYTAEMSALHADVRVSGVACPLFVSLAEEGWTQGEVARLTAHRYLDELVDGPDTLILGCTHFPLLTSVIQEVLPNINIINSATATANRLEQLLSDRKLHHPRPDRADISHRFLVTDNLQRFARVGSRFLPAAPDPIELVDIADHDDLQLTAGGAG